MNNAIIVLNAGSSSIKFSLFIERKDTLEPDVRGQIEGLYTQARFVSKGAQEALKVVTDMGNEIDMVILDLIMPGMDGGATFERIREIQPNMPVLHSSGYAINGHADKIMRKGCNGFIQKPYNITELSQKVRKVLDDAKGSTHAYVILL